MEARRTEGENPMTAGARTYGHLHAEAFMRMKYRCEGCGGWEWVWNSRDGVTPFMINSRCCDNAEAQHIQWQEDVYAPSYKLQPGDRFFRNGTAEDAIAITERMIERYADQGHTVPDDIKTLLRKDAAEQTGMQWHPGWPYVDEWRGGSAT